MSNRELLIYGAGGHGRVVAEAAEGEGRVVRGFIDDRVAVDSRIGAWTVVGDGDAIVAEGGMRQLAGGGGGVIVAVGDNAARWHLMNVLRGAGLRLATVVDPAARVSRWAAMDAGAFVAAAAVVQAEASVGPGAIINTAAVVDHHARVGMAAHIAPAAVLCGGAEVGDRALIGANATVLPGRIVGEDALVGAGAVVTRDVPARTRVAGSPARPLG